jgi:hypothetical protein
MTFRFSNGLPPAKTGKKSTRNIGLTANLKQLTLCDRGTHLTVTATPADNPASIPVVAARVFGKGGYSVKSLGVTPKGNAKFEVSIR